MESHSVPKRNIAFFAERIHTMKFAAEIDIMPHKALLDPQGKAVAQGLKNLGLPQLSKNVRIGKHIQLEIEADSKEQALEMANTACRQLLANPIMESFEVVLSELP